MRHEKQQCPDRATHRPVRLRAADRQRHRRCRPATCRSSNFSRGALKHAYLAAGWRDAGGNGTWTWTWTWTWHSLRHVFCTTALFTWKLDATDASCMAGHANVRTTLLMYIGTTAGVLDRARTATE
ncbi:MAG: integrase family protein [Actinomycetia bacterium]|nr:integrase family protein [Actinomycetes bacterium]